MILSICPHWRTFLINSRCLSSTLLSLHLLLDSLDIPVSVVGFGQVFLLETLHFVPPHLEDVTLNTDIVTRL